jgi:membrane protein implicated in regulation of membrane protease activity
MKTITKVFIFLVAFIPAIILVSSFTGQTAEIKYATIRTVESAVGSNSKVVLVYEGKTEEIHLDKATWDGYAPNALKINQAINILAAKGYELVAQSGGDMISMYSFVKK